MENKEFGTLFLTGDKVFKKVSAKGNTYYTTENKEKPFVLNEVCFIYGNKKNLSEVEVKKLINGEIVLMELLSKKEQKKYEALIKINGTDDKGYAIFSRSYTKKENVN